MHTLRDGDRVECIDLPGKLGTVLRVDNGNGYCVDVHWDGERRKTCVYADRLRKYVPCIMVGFRVKDSRDNYVHTDGGRLYADTCKSDITSRSGALRLLASWIDAGYVGRNVGRIVKVIRKGK